MLVQITLAIAAGAALINIWLGVRIGAVRAREKIGHGDGGNALLGRRMRAQLNFVENAPFVLILMLAIELSSGASAALLLVGLLFLIGRVLHGIGMDAGGRRLAPDGGDADHPGHAGRPGGLGGGARLRVAGVRDRPGRRLIRQWPAASTRSATKPLVARSRPKVLTPPWPGMKVVSSPIGQSFATTESISACVSP